MAHEYIWLENSKKIKQSEISIGIIFRKMHNLIDNVLAKHLLSRLVNTFEYNRHLDLPFGRIERDNSNGKIAEKMMMTIATSTCQHSQPSLHQEVAHQILSSLLPMISINHHLIDLYKSVFYETKTQKNILKVCSFSENQFTALRSRQQHAEPNDESSLLLSIASLWHQSMGIQFGPFYRRNISKLLL